MRNRYWYICLLTRIFTTYFHSITFMSTSFFAILKIIESPFVKNGYEELRECLIQQKQEHEAAALDALIAIKFHDNNPSGD